MIILKHLTVERFRLLREINLHFPQRGSILIQGPNEAGKSTLFESIYFALYGMPLGTSPNPQRSKSALDDLILYGSNSASVTLTLSVGATELTITRTIERGEGQQVCLIVRRLGMPPEQPIAELTTANERIISELGRIDSETLRNSCFIEQKGLTRLEDLSGAQRETTLRKLLGLEKLLCLTERFQLTPLDETLVQESRLRLQLAEIQARILELSEQLGSIEAALDAVAISEDLADVSQQEVEIAEQHLSLEQLQTQRAEIKVRQSRIQHLKKADGVLADIVFAYDTIATAQKEMPELEWQIVEIDRREREELPEMEKRVHDLVDLTRSFGTLERMSNDLLTVVATIKELEQEIVQQQVNQEDSDALEKKINHARMRVEEARESLHELEEYRRAGLPQLEARLHRLQELAGKLRALHEAEEQYTRRVMSQSLAEDNRVQLQKAQKDVRDTEQELVLVEQEAKQVQQQAEGLEQRWRQLSINRQLVEWRRLKQLSQGLAEAEQHVMGAHRQQATLTEAALAARQNATVRLIVFLACAGVGVFVGVSALFVASHQAYIASAMGIFAILLLAGAGLGYQNYGKARKEADATSMQMQEATNQVSMMVAAREAAIRMGGNHDAVERIEREIRSLGGAVPRSVDEAQQSIEQTQDSGESLADIQQRLHQKRDDVAAARNQVNVTMEAVAKLRKERVRLETLRKREEWDDLVAHLRADRIAIEEKQHEIASLAGQEGFPIPYFGMTSAPIYTLSAATPIPATTDTELALAISDAIKATEREIVSIHDKLKSESDYASQVKIHQDALEVLLARQKVLIERGERYAFSNPRRQIVQAREQQIALRDALHSLQDSLRQRVKPLGVPFGQAAIGSTEIAARKQLEALHVVLGDRVELQSRIEWHAIQLKEKQDSLSDYYSQLAKMSGSLGGWIIPPNPFADALVALRTRCQREIQEANEPALIAELEQQHLQERASQAKIALCRSEIENAHERIATILTQRNRPLPVAHGQGEPARVQHVGVQHVGVQHVGAQFIAPSFTQVVAVWPLVGEYSAQDRSRLEEECARLEQELSQSELQERELGEQLHIGGQRLDLEQTRLRMQQQERSYQTKQRGNLLIQAVDERLLRKMLSRTEYYMQRMLPLLTDGRYRDVQLWTAPEEGVVSGGPFQLRTWNAAAGEYVPRSALSGGAADQLSFALRLAFAVATLPAELSAAPGFLLLDEPLTSFDRSRTRALVDVVTGETL
ncbi:MAG TPA: AAA family ATPase, partial [Ktedonobacteraceae bacterium]|nr:AAA family ATPase [Ktedonobacteraceae bacterium]